MNVRLAEPNNRLAHTNSPYLLAHADNPVDWYPWGDEALVRARSDNQPILLSVGYATCHWCHVMEHESFRDANVAAFMNQHFVCIKVDREERPDIDAVYMTATVALTGHGGWPMTLFLTPACEVFYAGTYFPPVDRFGRPSFMHVMERIVVLWSRENARIMAESEYVTRQLRAMVAPTPAQAINRDLISTAIVQLRAGFDADWGGFDGAPKFPPHAALRLLFDAYQRDQKSDCLTMALTTLDHLQQGGIHDHVGGGFARYSTDAHWHVPHFEKMLYDNAQLAKAYLCAFRFTGADRFRATLERLLSFVTRELTDPAGGFYTALDADSEGVEGRYYVFDWHDFSTEFQPNDVEILARYFDVRPEGNWEGTNVLWTPRALTVVAQEFGRDTLELERLVQRAQAQLFQVRATRPRPLTDDKVIAGQTGLMLSAFAEAGRILERPAYVQVAERAARFLLDQMLATDGQLLRCARRSIVAQPAMLDDYAYVAEGLITLYETTGNREYIVMAERLANRMMRDFYDEPTARVYQSPHHQSDLLFRISEARDGALPNASATAADVLARLGDHFERPSWRELAMTLLSAHGSDVRRLPRAHADALCEVQRLHEPSLQVVFVPGHDEAENQVLAAACFGRHWAGQTLAMVSRSLETTEPQLPLLQNRTHIRERPQVFVCRDNACASPVQSVADLDRMLKRLPTIAETTITATR